MLHIQQQKITEKINHKIINELYNQSKKYESDPNTDLYGSVSSNYGYRSQVNYLNNKYNNFDVNILTDYYVEFKDPYMRKFWANCPIGDGFGVLESEYAKLDCSWGVKGTKYGITNNANYFGTSSAAVTNNNANDPVQRDILAQVLEFPEMIDLPWTESGRVFNDYYQPILYPLVSIKEVYIPRTVYYYTWGYGTYNNLELISFEYVNDNFASTNILGVDHAPKLKKLICAPSLVQIGHGNFIYNDCAADGCQFFIYATDISNVQSDISTWCLTGLHNAIFWVQDQLYNEWLNHRQIAPRLNTNLIVKKFSEYTGNDLIQKWIMT